MRVGEYLFNRLKGEGVTCTFGLPGDFALTLYAAQEACKMPTIVMTHEPSVGYAADVYGRLKGLGVALVTYGVGSLNMVNATAMAYAEESPLLVISGAPEVHWRESDVFFHHRVKSPETQLRVYQEVTVAQASINSPDHAEEEIDRVIKAVRELSRPGFIEIARDVVNMTIPVSRGTTQRAHSNPQKPPRQAMEEALAEITRRLNSSRRAVVYAGVEIERFGLMNQLRQFVEGVNIPVATSLMGKAVMPEHHRNFIGNYFGRLGPVDVSTYIENADCVLALGMMMTDMDTGIYTARIDRTKLIQATSRGTSISHHHYPDVTLKDLMRALLKKNDLTRHSFRPPKTARPQTVERTNRLTINAIIEELNGFLKPKHIVLADTGDCLFASVELRADMFIGPGYYASMGLAVPGAIGAQLARPDLRPIVLTGDGAFKMDGIEVATAADYGLNPIVIIINNRSFATLKVVMGDRPYLRLRSWNYVDIARAIGGRGESATTREAFRDALRRAEESDTFSVIDAVIDEDDTSPTLKRLGKKYGARVTAKKTRRKKR